MARGVERAQVVAVEQHSYVDGLDSQHGALLTIDTPEGRRAFMLSPDDAAEVGAALTRIAGPARAGLFIVTG